jgi:uncharacterized tellurite resistance protein B-like protein
MWWWISNIGPIYFIQEISQETAGKFILVVLGILGFVISCALIINDPLVFFFVILPFVGLLALILYSCGAFEPSVAQQKERLFAINITVLSAKLAKCDGPVNRTEVNAFKASFRIPPADMTAVGKVFNQARETIDGYEVYARQLGEAFKDDPILTQAWLGLYQIACSDAALNPYEMAFLDRVREEFGLGKGAPMVPGLVI